MEVTGVHWHPTDKKIILTSSLDGSVRVWDLEGEAAFGNLISKHILKIKGKTAGRIGATCCCFSPDGTKIVGGTSDGSIHVWNNKTILSSRADMIMKSTLTSSSGGALSGHGDEVTITSVVISPDNKLLASRGTDGKIIVWNLKFGNNNQTVPMHVYPNLINIYPQANVEFSPDSGILCCGTSVAADVWKQQLKSSHIQTNTGERPVVISSSDNSNSSPEAQQQQEAEKCFLLFFDLTSPGTVAPLLRIAVPNVGSLIYIKWQWNTNQIFCRYV